jgi:hypothetical protein
MPRGGNVDRVVAAIAHLARPHNLRGCDFAVLGRLVRSAVDDLVIGAAEHRLCLLDLSSQLGESRLKYAVPGLDGLRLLGKRSPENERKIGRYAGVALRIHVSSRRIR